MKTDAWRMQQIGTETSFSRPRIGNPGGVPGFSPRVLAAAAVTGTVSGLICVGLRYALRFLQWLITAHSGYLADAANALPTARRFLTPVAGAFIATLIIEGARRFRGSAKSVQYVEAVRFCHGYVPFAATCWQIVSSAFSIATGAAIGREGSMIQFAAAAISKAGQSLGSRWVPLQTLVALAAAGAAAAVYQAPIAGAFFALEIVIGASFFRNTLLSLSALKAMPALLVSSAAGAAMSHLLLGHGPLFPVGIAVRFGWSDCVPILVSAALLGAAGPVYFYFMKGARFLKRWPWPMVWSGAVVGWLSLIRPETWGNGDSSVLRLMSGELTFQTATTILLLRLCATAACVGSGVVGGVFTPTVFAGSALGLLLGTGFHLFFPATSSPLAYAVLGVGCLLAAVTHAPLMAAFMTAELTGTMPYLPIILACCLLSSETAERISPRSLYAVATPDPASPIESYCGAALEGFSGSQSK